jgi:hypothetical protein
MSYPSDLTDDRGDLLQPVSNAPGKRGREHADDLRTVVDAVLYIAQTPVSVALPLPRSVHGRGSGRSSGAGRASRPWRVCRAQ